MALSGIKIIGDYKWRNFLYGDELPKKWRKEKDWIKSDEEYASTSFVKYKNWVYALDEFLTAPKDLRDIGWDGIINDSYFSGVLIKLSSDGEQYKIGYYLTK